MATQLDPVTGAPLLTPDLGNIDQLPYKVQPVPLADQTNQPQLGRAYLYPDDVPPVLANINAMNGNQTDQAQTLHTDGNHALKVALSGGGAGGPVGMQSEGGGSWAARPHSSDIGFEVAPTVTVYGAFCSWWWDGSGTVPAHGDIQFLICSSTGFLGLLVADLGFFINGAATAEEKAGGAYFAFNPPLDPVASFLTDGSANIGMKTFNNSPLSLQVSGTLLLSIT